MQGSGLRPISRNRDSPSGVDSCRTFPVNPNRAQFAPTRIVDAKRRNHRYLWLRRLLIFLLSISVLPSQSAETVVTIERIPNEDATPGFRFESLPPPTINDAASSSILTLLSGSL